MLDEIIETAQSLERIEQIGIAMNKQKTDSEKVFTSAHWGSYTGHDSREA